MELDELAGTEYSGVDLLDKEIAGVEDGVYTG
jgi:hypothetical protein